MLLHTATLDKRTTNPQYLITDMPVLYTFPYQQNEQTPLITHLTIKILLAFCPSCDHVKQGWLRSCLHVRRLSGSNTTIFLRKSNSISFISFKVSSQLPFWSGHFSFYKLPETKWFWILLFSIPTMSITFLSWSSSLSPLNKVLPVTIKWKIHPSAHTSTSAPYLLAPSSNSGARQCSDPTIFVIDFSEKSSSFAMPRSMILRWQLLASMSAGSGCDCVWVFLGTSMMLEGFKSRWMMSKE